MPERTSILSTAELRRPKVVASAVRVFARSGYLGTAVAQVAADAGISTAYVFKLFPSKESLFVAALESCFDSIEEALQRGADTSADPTPIGLLDSMGDAYAGLISDRSLLLIQVHAQSAADVPEIRDALRRGLERTTRFASSRSGAPDSEVQRFIAYGQLCHLIVTLGLDDIPDHWARLLAEGIQHPDAP